MYHPAKAKNIKEQIAIYLMLFPNLLGLVGLVLIPALLSVGLAFTQFDALTSPVWVGFENIVRLFSDRLFAIKGPANRLP